MTPGYRYDTWVQVPVRHMGTGTSTTHGYRYEYDTWVQVRVLHLHSAVQNSVL
jgi:hypothetical protein